MSAQTPLPVGGRTGAAGRILITRQARNKTGCVGVILVRERRRYVSGIVLRKSFLAKLGTRRRVFSIDMLGLDLAWREAVRCRARWERECAARHTLHRTKKRGEQNARTQAWKQKNRAADLARMRARYHARKAERAAPRKEAAK